MLRIACRPSILRVLIVQSAGHEGLPRWSNNNPLARLQEQDLYPSDAKHRTGPGARVAGTDDLSGFEWDDWVGIFAERYNSRPST